jgi:hypothetical protein
MIERKMLRHGNLATDWWFMADQEPPTTSLVVRTRRRCDDPGTFDGLPSPTKESSGCGGAGRIFQSIGLFYRRFSVEHDSAFRRFGPYQVGLRTPASTMPTVRVRLLS